MIVAIWHGFALTVALTHYVLNDDCNELSSNYTKAAKASQVESEKPND